MRWEEWEGIGLGGAERKIMFTPAHTDDVSDLSLAIQRSGWLDRREANEVAHITNLQTGWYGYVDGEYSPHACDEDGVALVDSSEVVEIAMPFTWILVN
jgi:hypothetical protein